MIVPGIRARIIRLGILVNILYITILTIKKPGRWLIILKEIRKKRKSIQGLPKVEKYVKEGGRYFFSENIPGWPSRAFNGFFRNEIMRISDPGKKSPLSTVIIAITSKCRLACGHCYEWKNISRSENLTLNQLKGILTSLKKTGVRHFQLSGGEPLERFDDLLEMVRLLHDNSDIWILTSGFGFSPDKARALKKSGLTGADISLDHWNEAGHNSSRNNSDAFYWAREAVKNCRESGLVTSLSLCAFKSFVSGDNLLKYYSLAREWKVGFIRLLEPRQAGKLTGIDVELNRMQTDLLEKFYQDANSSSGFFNYPLVTYPGYNQRRTGCIGAGNRYLYIDSAGEIHACPFCQQSAGNAVSTDFKDAIARLKIYGCHKYSLNLTD